MVFGFQKSINKIVKIAQFCAGPHPIYWLMPWFMILLVLGTITQKSLGLYDAVQTYLYDFILWFGPIPLPGGGLTLALITFSLALKFLFFSPWSWKRSGIILSHLGSLMLLLGGFVTILYSQEGYMIIPEGEERSYYQDYHDKNLFVYQEDQEIFKIDFNNLNENQTLQSKGLPFTIAIQDTCDNCDIRPADKTDETRKNLAREISIHPKVTEINKEENFSGVTFMLFDKSDTSEIGTFIALEDVPQDSVFEDYQIKIERRKTDLPFTIALEDFRKIDYPGTRKAQNYQSDLIFKENDIHWPVMIEMNQPYRYKGYSIFQSSFDQKDGTEITVLNIVKNSGRLLPYISTLIIFLGLFIHLISRTVRRNKAAEKASEV